MKRKGIHILLCMLLVVMMIPATAFATGGHTVGGDLDLTGGKNVGTLETDGYTWDESTHTLTMQDLTVTGEIELPNADCQIHVKGNCKAENIRRNYSSEAQAVTITGETGASFSGQIRVSGNLTLTDLTMTDGEIYNGSVGLEKVLKLKNSEITLQSLSWMTLGGIDLEGSRLMIDKDGYESAQFNVEKIAMDKISKIESYTEMWNYGHFTPQQQGLSNDYITYPAGGYFGNITGGTDKSLTIFDKDGRIADHFILQAPEPQKEMCTITLKASPAEGGTVSGEGTYASGTNVTITAQANKGYHFVQWQDYEGKSVSQDAAYQFTVTETVDYTAVFEKGEAVTPSQPGGTDQNDSGSGAAKTGDSSHPGLWIALMAASALSIAAVVIVKKRRSLT